MSVGVLIKVQGSGLRAWSRRQSEPYGEFEVILGFLV